MLLPYSKWSETSLGTRNLIAQIFGIPKIRSTHVVDNKVMDDGYNIKQVEEVVSVSNIKNYLDNRALDAETDIVKLFNYLVDKVEGRPTGVFMPEPVKEEPIKVEVKVEEPVETKIKMKKVVKKLGAKKKK